MLAATTTLLLPPAPASAARPVPSGRILYIQFSGSTGGFGDIQSAEPDGANVFDYGIQESFYSQPDYSPDGTQVTYIDGFSIRAMTADGSDNRRLTGAPFGPSDPQWSPDGQWIAFETGGQVWKISPDVAGGAGQTVIDTTDNLSPVWSPNSQRIATATSELDSIELWRASDGRHLRTIAAPAGTYQIAWSPNGKTIAVDAADDIYLIDVSSGTVRQLTNTPDILELTPVWSPDGKWIAYAVGPGPYNPDVPQLTSDPVIWLMDSDGGHQHSTGIHGWPSSWRFSS